MNELNVMRNKCIFMCNWLSNRGLYHECEKDYKESILAWGKGNCFSSKEVKENKLEAEGGLDVRSI